MFLFSFCCAGFAEKYPDGHEFSPFLEMNRYYREYYRENNQKYRSLYFMPWRHYYRPAAQIHQTQAQNIRKPVYSYQQSPSEGDMRAVKYDICDEVGERDIDESVIPPGKRGKYPPDKKRRSFKEFFHIFKTHP